MKGKNKFIINNAAEYSPKDDPLHAEFSEPDAFNNDDEIKPVPFLKLFRYATRLGKFLIFFGIICTAGAAVMQPLNMLVFGQLTSTMVDYATALFNVTASAEDQELAAQVFFDGIISFALNNTYLGVATFIFSYLSTVLFNYSGLRQIYKIRCLYLEKTLNQDIGWFDLNQTGDFASRMSDDLSKFEDGIGEKVSMFLTFVITFIASLILALVKGWELALICLISLPVTMIALGLIALLTSKLAKKELDAYGAAGAIAEEVLSSIRTVVAFGGQVKETDRYSDKLVFACDNNIRRTMLFGIGFGLLWFFIYASYALAFWYGVGLVLRDRNLPEEERIYDAGNMVTVFFSVMTGSMNFGIASPYIETFGLAQAAAAKIYSIIDNIPVINKSKGVGDRPEKIEGNIVFQDVHFHYPSRATVQILNGLNLTIKAGETVALVGSSGCGKSTCLQLIQRFYDPLSGSVSLDGKNLKNLDLEWLRQHIGVVSQEPVLFATTIGENIRYGYKTATQEDIERAAVKANAHSFIKNLPDGYNTIVGERGAQLSGGQKQRIAIARALVRDPSILLLDEATSALDTNSEAKVQAALDMASKERTTIIVAHRLSTIRGANKIVVISKGQVVEQGTHDELMALKQEYFNLVTTQVTSDDIDRKPDAALSTVDFDEDIDQTVTPKGVNVEEEQSTPAEMASLWTVMKMNASEWWQIFVGCISSLIMGGAMPIFAVLFGEIIGILAEEEDVVREETNKYSLYFVITGIVVGTATFFQIYMFGIAGERLTMRLRIEMFRAMLAQEMGWYDKPKNGVGALCARLSGDAAHVQGATGQRVGTVLQSVATIGLAVGLSMYYEWRLGLLALAFTPFILLATFGEQRLMNVENQSQSETLQKSIKLAVEAVSNVRTVVSLGIEKSFNEEYVNKLNPHFKRTKRNTHFRAFVLGLARSLMFFAFSACMYYGGILIRDDGIAYSDVFKVSQALIMGTVSIANALAFAPNFRKGLTAVHKVLKLINRQPRVADAPGAIDKTWNSAAIDYSEVYFSYPTRLLTTVLKGLDLSILEGQTVALVGPSGCGKSTVIQLLERFYDPTDGKIEVDKTDTKQITLSSLRRQLGIVSQEPILFDRTIAENIAYGDNSREILADEIVEAARKANIHNFVTGLPLGYETRLGEKGTQLSGGQKQRVAIARALVRNPKVLLLDEATSALDTESEKIVQEALDKAKVGRTCIIIAHRLSTIQDADVICVINDGKVAEMGTHSDLLALKGLYHRLHTVQDRK